MIFAVPSHSTNRAAPSSVMDFSPGARADLAVRYKQARAASVECGQAGLSSEQLGGQI